MKVMVLGSGAREHALALKLGSSPRVTRVFAAPGNAGTAACATNLPEVDPLAFDTVARACRVQGVDCVFVGPEAPLAAGVVDFLQAEGIAAIGPARGAAQLESSKAFSKAFLLGHAIPTAGAVEFHEPEPFSRHVRAHAGRRLVIKKSGLAAGKGVLESTDTEEMIGFGNRVLTDDSLLVEEFLEGWEVSIFGLSDGKSFLVLPPCTDFKKAFDGDTGPNTGGMGAICPVPWADEALMRRIQREVVVPTYRALAADGLAYAGVLYFGLMVTAQGPKVLEFNVRFGDPETQALMPMLGFDLGEVVEAMANGTLGRLPTARGLEDVTDMVGVVAAPGAALGVVIASRGYPEQSHKGAAVQEIPTLPEGSFVFHASTARGADGILRTGGGRCFTAVGTGADLRAAAALAYQAAAAVRFEGGWHRGDIGLKFMGATR
jgi:phosphoribosylamine--glycine ligase